MTATVKKCDGDVAPMVNFPDTSPIYQITRHALQNKTMGQDTNHFYEREEQQGGLFFASLWVALAFLFVPLQSADAAEASYIVTETVETFEYQVSIPQPEAMPTVVTLGEYGPFRVITSQIVEMAGTVDSFSPDYFREMLIHHPSISQIIMIDCSGSVDEAANLNLARMIRRAGINTHVPAHGSVRSGAVELFLAGALRSADPGAEFVVHSWMDEDGLEANDYPANDPVHTEYLEYYTEMGVPSDQAQAFYTLTNSVPFAGQLTLSRSDLVRYQLLQ
jgi:hypothetical protein